MRSLLLACSLVALCSLLLLSEHDQRLVHCLVEVSRVLQYLDAPFKSESKHHASNLSGVFVVNLSDLSVQQVPEELMLCLHVSLGPHVVHRQLSKWILLLHHLLWLLLNGLHHRLLLFSHWLLMSRLHGWHLLLQCGTKLWECLLVKNWLLRLLWSLRLIFRFVFLLFELRLPFLFREVSALASVLVGGLVLLTRLILVRLLVVVEVLLIHSWVLSLVVLSLRNEALHSGSHLLLSTILNLSGGWHMLTSLLIAWTLVSVAAAPLRINKAPLLPMRDNLLRQWLCNLKVLERLDKLIVLLRLDNLLEL